MEEAKETYIKFQKFLKGYLIRRVEGQFAPDDFNEDKSEYLRPHLEKLLPSLTLTEAMRIRTYFNDMFIFHLTDKLGEPVLPSQPPSSPITVSDEEDVQSPRSKKRKTHSQTTEISAVSSSSVILKEQTPAETYGPTQRRTTAPIMQSTPLSVAIAVGEETGILLGQQRLERDEENDFIADIISQINLSPIPQPSAHPASPDLNGVTFGQSPTCSVPNVGRTEFQFLRGFADIMDKANKPKQAPTRSTPTTTRDRVRLPIIEPRLRQAKEKKRKIDFEVLCGLAQKRRTEEQSKRADESFLYFPLMPGKTRSMITRITKNVVIPEGERGHIRIDRIISLSNVLRAHASQRQTSVDQPGQTSLLTSLRSPCTPQALLRTSQMQSFTPIRGDILNQTPAMEMDQVLSIPSRSLLRQQPLFTIPERDSSLQVPLSPQLEEIPFNNSISIPPLSENISAITINAAENVDSLSNFPSAIPEDIEIIDEQPRPSHAIFNDNAVLPMQIDESPLEVIPENNIVTQIEAQIDIHEDEAHFSWFEVLRPREYIAYPRVDVQKRKRKKRRREREQDVQPIYEELPEIPTSSHCGIMQNLTLPPDAFSNQITEVPVPNYAKDVESELTCYFDLIKDGGKHPEYRTWGRFDPYLFSENDDFEMYTYIFKRIIKDNFVAMDTLYPEGTTRLEAAKGFRLVLELKTIGLIEIEAVDTRIIGFKFKTADDYVQC